MVIGIAFTLPTGFYILLENIQQLTAHSDNTIQITLFLKHDVSDDQALKLANTIFKHKSVGRVEVLKRDEVLAEYQALAGYRSHTNMVEDNPFSPLILIEHSDNTASSEQLKILADELRKLPEVEISQFDQYWVERFQLFLTLITRITIFLFALIVVGVLLIIGNTIRLSLFHKRTEIEVAKLFGATDVFIRRPYLYGGLWLGLLGGLMAWAVVAFFIEYIRNPIVQFTRFYNNSFELIGLDQQAIIILLCSSSLTCLIGAWLSVKRHLKNIEPS